MKVAADIDFGFEPAGAGQSSYIRFLSSTLFKFLFQRDSFCAGSWHLEFLVRPSCSGRVHLKFLAEPSCSGSEQLEFRTGSSCSGRRHGEFLTGSSCSGRRHRGFPEWSSYSKINVFNSNINIYY
jgi:hypothetical protein